MDKLSIKIAGVGASKATPHMAEGTPFGRKVPLGNQSGSRKWRRHSDKACAWPVHPRTRCQHPPAGRTLPGCSRGACCIALPHSHEATLPRLEEDQDHPFCFQGDVAVHQCHVPPLHCTPSLFSTPCTPRTPIRSHCHQRLVMAHG